MNSAPRCRGGITESLAIQHVCVIGLKLLQTLKQRDNLMSDEPENLILVYLRRLDSKLDQVIETLRDHGRRLTSLEISVGNAAATEMTHYANTSLRADRVDDRRDRIERRLDLKEG